MNSPYIVAVGGTLRTGSTTEKAMRHALVTHGSLIYEAPAAYLYRYLMTGLPDTPIGRALVREILDEETESIKCGALWPLGRRWVVEP